MRLLLVLLCAASCTGETPPSDPSDAPGGASGADARAGSDSGPTPGDDGPPQATPDAACTLPGPLASDGPWSCPGLTGESTNPDRVYYTTSFGCWVDEAGDPHSDAGDNCIPACSVSSIGCAGMSGPDCERFLNWYTADTDRFGCGTKLKVTNVEAGLAAILVAIDRGPNCSVENNVDFWVLDMSYRASYYFFGGPTSAGERAAVEVEIVDPSTPLGPTAIDACP